MIPFVTEEIWGYLPGAEDRPPLVVAPYPEPEPELLDPDAEDEVRRWIELTRQVRRWRDLVGVSAGTVLPARVAGGGEPLEFVWRLARLSLDGAGGEALATIGPVEILGSAEVDSAEVTRRVGERLEELRAEVTRAERKLANEGFVKKAPAEVVEEEREKLAAYRAELEELDG
jgi:valyl-tRNA synthetase